MVRMETEVVRRLYSGVNFLATSLSRTALQLEQVQERLSSDVDSTLVNPQIRNRGVAGTTADLNWIVGRQVFS